MRKKPVITFSILVAIAAAILYKLKVEGYFSSIVRVPRQIDVVETVVPVKKQIAKTKIAAISTGTEGIDRGVNLKGRFSHFWLSPISQVFPDPSLLEVWLPSNRQDNPPLLRYVQTDPRSRKDDFVLSTPSRYEWRSAEYLFQGKPAKFTCDFIIRMEDTGTSQTTIEIIEIMPTVTAGRRFEMPAHGFVPQFFPNQQYVAPTNKDRQELLDAIKDAISGVSNNK